jgi:hypothetical protein
MTDALKKKLLQTKNSMSSGTKTANEGKSLTKQKTVPAGRKQKAADIG